jgi:hypothetical protein
MYYRIKLYGFSDETIELISNYLNGRRFKVKVNGSLSRFCDVSKGVPQGSVLGPLFFLVFINDICFLNLKSKITLFADDTTICFESINYLQVVETIQDDMATIEKWLIHNQLYLNWDKTHAILFDLESKTQTGDIIVGNNKIRFENNTKLLGVIIDQNLNFNDHIGMVIKKVNTKLYILSRSLNLFTTEFKSIVFKLFIYSHFEYCSTIFFVGNIIKKLNRTYYKAIRMFFKIKISRTSIEAQYNELIEFNICPLAIRHPITIAYSFIMLWN